MRTEKKKKIVRKKKRVCYKPLGFARVSSNLIVDANNMKAPPLGEGPSGRGAFLPYHVRPGDSLPHVYGEGKRDCQGSRYTIQGIGISVSLGTEYVGVIGRFPDRLSRLLLHLSNGTCVTINLRNVPKTRPPLQYDTMNG